MKRALAAWLSHVLIIMSTVCSPAWAAAVQDDLSGYLAVESRLFPEKPLFSRQRHNDFSLALELEYYRPLGSSMGLVITPYGRYDFNDDQRSHWDIRDLYWEVFADNWELRVGIRNVFWGVTESNHLVDIINQTDFVENIDGEKKLGQPMINLAWIRPWGTVDFFLLAGFRERTFPGREGRLRFPIPVDSDNPTFESSGKNERVDWALRWAHTLGDVDVGISHFSGTGREPLFRLAGDEETGSLRPHYHLIDQTGIDIQMTKGGWLLKLELISRQAGDRRMTAFTSGFEYTFGNVGGRGLDIGLVGEYLFDDRDLSHFAPTPFRDDIFLATRLAFNDVQSTELLAGAIVDPGSGSSFANVEGSRRFGASFKFTLEIRGILNASPEDFLYAFRRDSYGKVELARYF